MRIIFWIGGICVSPFAGMLLLGFLIGPGHQNPDRSEAMRNLRDIALSLFEFDAAYGRFPDASTIPAVKSATRHSTHLGRQQLEQTFPPTHRQRPEKRKTLLG